MKLAISAVLVSMALTGALAAQSATDGPPPPAAGERMHRGGPHGPHGPGGFGGWMHGVETIPNSPFTAQFTDNMSFTGPDGKQEQRTSTTMVYRDSQGRVRQEITPPPPPPPPAANGADIASAPPRSPRAPRTMITISDPVAHTITRLDADRQTAFVHTVPADFFTHAQMRDEHRGTTPDAEPRRGNATRSDLGSKVIGGVSASGEQTVLTLPARDGGTAHTVTRQTWFSPDAKFEVSSSETSDRGTHSRTLTSFSKAEPNPSLFQVPVGYTTTSSSGMRPGHHRPGGPEGGDGPPEPPPAPPAAQ